MLVQTSWLIPAPPGVLWPLLCNSHMDHARSCMFGLGVPEPVECRLPDGHGGVGSTRECVSDQGKIQQEILVWEPGQRLSFRMRKTDLFFRSFVNEIVETFDLEPRGPGQTRVTRSTRLGVIGRFRPIKMMILYLGLKKVHRFVFRNWSRLASERVKNVSSEGVK